MKQFMIYFIMFHGFMDDVPCTVDSESKFVLCAIVGMCAVGLPFLFDTINSCPT